MTKSTVEIDHELTERKKEFRLQACALSKLFLEELIHVVPFHSEDLVHFSKLTSVKQQALTQSLKNQIHIIQEMRQQGMSPIKNSRVFVLSFLREEGLTPAGDLLDNLSDSDFVAIYNDQQQIVFLTPNHFTWMTYSLEELLCKPWYELFRRDPEVEKILMGRVLDFVRGLKSTTVNNRDVPPHTVSQTGGIEPIIVTCYSKFYSPIFKENKSAGFLAANQDRVMYERSLRRDS